MEHREFVNRFKSDVGDFTEDVQKIFVDSSIEVIDSMRELVGHLFDDVKSLVDNVANSAKDSGELANEYVRRNPWKAAVGFVLISVAVGAIAGRNKKHRADEELL